MKTKDDEYAALAEKYGVVFDDEDEFAALPLSEADRRAAEQRYRSALDDALGDASLVVPTYRAWLGIVARHGDSPDVGALTDPERDVLELWQAAESAAITAAFGPHRYLDDAWFEIRL